MIIPSFYPLFKTAHTVSKYSADSFFIFLIDAVSHYFIVSLLLMIDAE